MMRSATGVIVGVMAALSLAAGAGGCVHVRNAIYNTAADATEVLRLDVSASLGTDMGAHLMLTRSLQLKSYSYEDLWRVGLGTRIIGMWREDRQDWWVGPWHDPKLHIAARDVRGLTAALPERMRSGPDAAFLRWGEGADEVGVGLHAFVLGVRLGLRPMELVDMLANFVGLDPCGDNLSWRERQALHRARRPAKKPRSRRGRR